VLAGAVVTGFWAGPLAHAFGASRTVPVAEHRVVVRAGDTLWSIAHRVAPGEDPRALVDAMAASNHVDPGALVPGQMLVVSVGV
jgi:nucleoid-associated protein YgaU